MDETCRLRQGEGYGVCADEVVSKCALRDKKKKSLVFLKLLLYFDFSASSYKKLSSSERPMSFAQGMVFSRIAPF